MRDRRVVVKIGSSSLTDDHGRLSVTKLAAHAEAVAALRRSGRDVVSVSSGAVAAGTEALGLARRPSSTAERQATAAVGQALLMAAYNDAYGRSGVRTAQILLTRHDFSRRESYKNALGVFEGLLARDVLPIVNENDTTSTAELTFGDNDMLAALVAALVHADRLVVVTDTDGLYDADPRSDPAARRIPSVPAVTPEVTALAGGTGSSVGTGGMAAKVRAAARALSLGVPVFVGVCRDPEALVRACDGDGDGTYFGKDAAPAVGRKHQWIAFHSPVEGAVQIDDGAVTALASGGKSLLPAGVVSVSGTFGREAVVDVLDGRVRVVGRGVVRYSAAELREAAGRSTSHAREVLAVPRPEVIHRDEFVSLGEE